MRKEIWYQSASQLNVSEDSPTFDPGWRNTERWRFGTEYKPFSKGLALRAGYYFDPSPIPDKAVSLSNIIELDREVITVGVGYEWESAQIDLTYLYTNGSANIAGVDYEKTVNSIQAAVSYWF